MRGERSIEVMEVWQGGRGEKKVGGSKVSRRRRTDERELRYGEEVSRSERKVGRNRSEGRQWRGSGSVEVRRQG